MAEEAKKKADYDDLYNIPENMTGQIIDGDLIVTPRAIQASRYAASALGSELGPPYQFGRGGGARRMDHPW